MGTYCTTTAMETMLPGTNNFNTAMASKCITWAEDHLNTKLGKRYDISDFDATVPLINSMCEQYSIGLYFESSGRGGVEAQERAAALFQRVDEKIDMIIIGRMNIHNAAGSIISRRGNYKGVLSNTSDYESTFNEDSPLDWEIDEDKLQDIESNRD